MLTPNIPNSIQSSCFLVFSLMSLKTGTQKGKNNKGNLTCITLHHCLRSLLHIPEMRGIMKRINSPFNHNEDLTSRKPSFHSVASAYPMNIIIDVDNKALDQSRPAHISTKSNGTMYLFKLILLCTSIKRI